MGISRRRLLIGGLAAGAFSAGGGYLLVERGVLPGRAPLDRALGRCDIDIAPLSRPAGPIVTGNFPSQRRRTSVAFRIAYPPKVTPGVDLPVCLVLHGFASDAAHALSVGRYPEHLAAHVAAGGPAFALAAMDGGPGYWHPHATDDPLGALFEEFLPLLATHGLRTARIAALGWSMGGYGALLCGITAPHRVIAVAASAPAFWRSYPEARRVNPVAFDSADEWRRYDILARAGQLRGLRLRIDCGERDSFAPAVLALRDRLPDRSVVHLAPGCHDGRFWQYAAPAQLAMIGAALRDPR